MSRVNTGAEMITVRPQNNVYTVLVLAATLVQAIGLVVIFLRAKSQFGGLL
jgi:hypothetical protein